MTKEMKILIVHNLLWIIGAWKERFIDGRRSDGFFDVESIRRTFPGALENIDYYLIQRNVWLGGTTYFTPTEACAIRSAIKNVADATNYLELEYACGVCGDIAYLLNEKIVHGGKMPVRMLTTQIK